MARPIYCWEMPPSALAAVAGIISRIFPPPASRFRHPAAKHGAASRPIVNVCPGGEKHAPAQSGGQSNASQPLPPASSSKGQDRRPKDRPTRGIKRKPPPREDDSDGEDGDQRVGHQVPAARVRGRSMACPFARLIRGDTGAALRICYTTTTPSNNIWKGSITWIRFTALCAGRHSRTRMSTEPT